MCYILTKPRSDHEHFYCCQVELEHLAGQCKMYHVLNNFQVQVLGVQSCFCKVEPKIQIGLILSYYQKISDHTVIVKIQ